MVNPINSSDIINYGNIKGKVREAEQEEFKKALENAVKGKDKEKLKKACNNLEAIFTNMVFKQMRNTVQKSGLFGEDYAGEIYEDMLFDKYAEEASKSNVAGLGDILYKQLLKSMDIESGEDNVK